MVPRLLFLPVMLAAALHATKGPVTRTTLPLDGTWEVGESVAATPAPSEFAHKAPVPGLANLATPPFADVDRFDSRELIDVEIRDKKRPESERRPAPTSGIAARSS
jgi:hypothetical protein